MARPIDYTTDADFVALSFMDYLRAARLRSGGAASACAARWSWPAASTPPRSPTRRSRTSTSIRGRRGAGRCGRAGGRGHGGRPPAAASTARRSAPPLEHIPPPRYDLVETAFSCRWSPRRRAAALSLQLLPAQHPSRPYRTRPVEDVIRDLTATAGLPFHQRKLAMLVRQQPRRRHRARQGAAARDREAQLLGHRRAVQHRLPCRTTSTWTCWRRRTAAWRSSASSRCQRGRACAREQAPQPRGGVRRALRPSCNAAASSPSPALMLALDEDTPGTTRPAGEARADRPERDAPCPSRCRSRARRCTGRMVAEGRIFDTRPRATTTATTWCSIPTASPPRTCAARSCG